MPRLWHVRSRDWPAFADSAAALQYLKQHYKLVILSNVDNGSFAFSNKKLGVEFDAIFTAEDIGSYKPSPRNFEYMLEKLDARGIGKGDILHTAESLFHDHGPANASGSPRWIHRRHDKRRFRRDDEPRRDAEQSISASTAWPSSRRRIGTPRAGLAENVADRGARGRF